MGNSPHKIDELVPVVLGCVAFARSSKGMGSSMNSIQPLFEMGCVQLTVRPCSTANRATTARPRAPVFS